MAQRRWTSQFAYSMERMLVKLPESITQSGSTGAFAAKVTQGLTLTAVTMGSAGNSITIAFTAGGTAGSEVVSVSGNAISVQIDTGVSSITQVRTALNASAAAAALVTTTGTSASAVVAASALPLLSGADTVFTTSNSGTIQTPMTITQTGTGIFKIALADSYNTLLGISIMIQKASATDVQPQIISSDVTTAQSVTFRILAGATPTNLASGDKLFIELSLRNSAS